MTMHAAILSIGDELITGTTRDANACWLAEQLASIGIRVHEMRLVPDDRAAIARTMAELAREADLLLITGGLGPTADDLTRESLNDVVGAGRPPVLDEDGLQQVERWFTRRGKPMPAINRVQAMRPATAALIENRHGTAPGLRATFGSCDIIIMPGVPREMRAMFLDDVLPQLTAKSGDQVLLKGSIHLFGLGESAAAERLGELLERTHTPTVGTTASEGIVSARIYASGQHADAERELRAVAHEIRLRLDPYAFGRDDETLAGVLGELLRARNERLATAESCTGGGIGAMITSASGSSDWYTGGWITYTNDMKTAQLGVPAELFKTVGAVSREVAEAMARGALERSGADYALSVTGIAGPAGGSEAKPVGTVYIGLASRRVEPVAVHHFLFTGDRDGIRLRTAFAALQILRFRLLGVAPDVPLSFEVTAPPSGASRTPSVRSS